MDNLTAAEIVQLLDLRPHPEGGYYRETFRDPTPTATGRSASTLIYFLLEAGQVSVWHRIDATEVWNFHAGSPLLLTMSKDGHEATAHRVGTALTAGEHPHFVVPPHYWQTAVSLGAWTLVSCTVAPGFEFATFEVAPAGWRPSQSPA